MCRIAIFLLIMGMSLKAAVGQDANAMKMEGGTVIEDMKLFSQITKIKKKKDAADTGETKCLGIIFSSVAVFTPMSCELTEANKGLWAVEGIGAPAVPVGKVTDGRHKLDFKRVDLEVPGLELVETDTGKPKAAPFNQNPDDVMEPAAVVYAFGDKVKACAVKVITDDPDECVMLYKAVVAEHPDLGLPAEPDPSIYCAVKGEEKMNLTLVGPGDEETAVEIDVGMPCGDSLGSPVQANRLVFGMVVGAFCGTTKVALIQSSFIGLSFESYTEKGGLSPTEQAQDDDGVTETEEDDDDDVDVKSEEKPKTQKPKQPKEHKAGTGAVAKTSSAAVFDRMQICCVLMLSALVAF